MWIDHLFDLKTNFWWKKQFWWKKTFDENKFFLMKTKNLLKKKLLMKKNFLNEKNLLEINQTRAWKIWRTAKSALSARQKRLKQFIEWFAMRVKRVSNAPIQNIASELLKIVDKSTAKIPAVCSFASKIYRLVGSSNCLAITIEWFKRFFWKEYLFWFRLNNINSINRLCMVFCVLFLYFRQKKKIPVEAHWLKW